ncbi:MAG: AbrB/MazE/SpoVT family DNA-binding domain-containing protein [Defluviitaleaceae bacterium]|nr:AbrB/MazE/SpoVT family DNA-binding domain-containing protein [Defluviitaleaceae bacterium]
MEFVAEKKIDELGRIVVPTEVRQAKGWGEGTTLAIYTQNDCVVLMPCKSDYEQET